MTLGGGVLLVLLSGVVAAVDVVVVVSRSAVTTRNYNGLSLNSVNKIDTKVAISYLN